MKSDEEKFLKERQILLHIKIPLKLIFYRTKFHQLELDPSEILSVESGFSKIS